jgi:hypothetical protein
MASWNRGNDDPSKAPANAAEKEIISNEFDEATGIRTIQYITINKAGKTVQVQEKTKETKRMVKSNKNVNERKKWAKFGDCQGMPKGPEKNITYLSAEKLSFGTYYWCYMGLFCCM